MPGIVLRIGPPTRRSPGGEGDAQPPNNQGPNLDTLNYCTEGSALRQQALAERMPCTLQSAATGIGVHGHMSAAPRSLHPGGVNGAFLDAHVGFIGDDVDVIAMAHLVSVTDE